jgi:hypothetical protein
MTPSSRQFALATYVLGCCLYLTGACQSIALPLAAKLSLPQLGGTPWHWTIFQAMFGGAAGLACVLVFALRHWTAWRSLLLAGLALGIASLAYFGASAERGAFEIEILLVFRLFAPFGAAIFAMHFTALAMLGWLCSHDPGSSRRPYLLYGLCLLGISHGLLAYPFVVGRLVPLQTQWSVFLGTVVAVGLGFVAVGVLITTNPAEPDLDPARPAKPLEPTWTLRLFWMLLAGMPSATDMLTSTRIATDLAPMPLLWLVPMYLLGLGWVSALSDPSAQDDARRLPAALRVLALLPVVVLASMYLYVEPRPSLYGVGIGALLMLPFVTPLRWNFTLLLIVIPVQIGEFYEADALGVPLPWRMGLCFLSMALVSRVCLGQLVRIVPGPERFVEWLLLASMGAGVCRVLVQDLSPLIFTTLLEYPITLGLAWAVCVVVRVMRDRLEPANVPDPQRLDGA